MPFNSDILQDASLQQVGEDLQVWETAGFAQRQDSLGGGHVQIYHRVKEEYDRDDLDLNRNHEHGVDCLLPVKVEQEEMSEPVGHLQHVIEDHHLQISETRGGGSPTWLSTAALRQPNQSLDDRETAVNHAGCETNTTVASRSHSTHTHLFLVQGTGGNASSSQHGPLEEHGRKANDQSELGINRQHKRMATELNLTATELNLTAAHGRCPQPSLEPSSSHPPGAASRSYLEEYNEAVRDTARQEPEWADTRMRSLIVTHPMYPQMLAKHVACLRVGTPVEQLPEIEAQLIEAPAVTEKYRVLRDQINDVTPEEQADLDRYMIAYTSALGSLEGTLEHHIRTDVTDALMSSWDIELKLYDLTGARPEPGNEATMSDDDDEDYDGDGLGIDFHDVGALGPLEPSESERSLMERVREELKQELQQGYQSKLEDVRDEILRKRRVGKLPEGTTAILKNWWDAHANWPYPTEEEKEILTQQTGLELKQVNNWFINQRKRNWQGNPMNPRTGQVVDPKGKARKSW